GIFDVENPLDVPVTVLVGAENSLAAHVLRNEPLQVFPPGKHPKAYWVRFGGPSLTWTLRGSTSTVDGQTRPCMIDDYQLVETDVATQSVGVSAANATEINDYSGFQYVPLSSLVTSSPPTVPADDAVLIL